MSRCLETRAWVEPWSLAGLQTSPTWLWASVTLRGGLESDHVNGPLVSYRPAFRRRLTSSGKVGLKATFGRTSKSFAFLHALIALVDPPLIIMLYFCSFE